MRILKYLIAFFYDLKKSYILNKKINYLYNNLPSKIIIPKEIIRRHKSLWLPINSKLNLKWIKTYISINKKQDPAYITEQDYYIKIEPVLNNKTFCTAYSDKNFYGHFINNVKMPKIYLRCIDGELYDENYIKIKSFSSFINDLYKITRIIVVKKSIDSGGGADVELYKNIDNNIWIDNHNQILSESYLYERFSNNFIIQEYINQHPYFSKFNNSSVNTIRLLTYRSVSNNHIIPLHSVLRIGKPKAIVDNQASGGIACGINENGKLNDFAINKFGEKYFEYNGIKFSNTEPVLKYKEIVDIGLRIARKFYYHRLLGFDFCVDEKENIILIEINNKNNEINFFQMSNGPLFREYTSEIIDFYLKNEKTYSIDFNIK